MGNGEQRCMAADSGELTSRSPVKLQSGRPAKAHDFDIAPQDAVRVSGAERLHRGFFRGEAAGKVDGGYAPLCAIGDLFAGENSTQKPIAVLLDNLGDAFDVGGVDSDSDDPGHGE